MVLLKDSICFDSYQFCGGLCDTKYDPSDLNKHWNILHLWDLKNLTLLMIFTERFMISTIVLSLFTWMGMVNGVDFFTVK